MKSDQIKENGNPEFPDKKKSIFFFQSLNFNNFVK